MLREQREREKEELALAQAEQLASEGEAKEKGEAQSGDAAEAEQKKESAEQDEGGDDDEEQPLDVMAVENICDIGDGEPLFLNFLFEDWALMSLRFEMHLLVRAFKKDIDDPDRPGMHESHLPFYYNKYYRKQLNTKFFGAATPIELIDMVKDAVGIDTKTNVVISRLQEDAETQTDVFIKLTEVARRERQCRIDSGDETARLRFSVLASQPTPQMPMNHVQVQQMQQQQHQVVPGNMQPRTYQGAWPQQARPGWQRPVGFSGQVGYRPVQGRWPGQQAYAPKQPAGAWR